MNAREEEEYYIYERPPRPKKPPTLDPDLVKAMKREGLDKRFRFLWSGVVIVRDSEMGEPIEIVGDRAACEYEFRKINGVPVKMLVTRYPQVRSKQTKHWRYRDVDNKGNDIWVTTTRPDLIPTARMIVAEPVLEYYEFGQLRWHIEECVPDAGRDTLDELDDATDDGWQWIMTLQTVRGTYYRPGVEMIPVLKKRLHQNENADLAEVAAEQKAKNEAKEAADKAKQDADLLALATTITNELLSFTDRVPHSTS